MLILLLFFFLMKITLYGLCESIRTYLVQNCESIVNITVKKPLLSDFYSNDQHTLGFYPRTQWLKLRHLVQYDKQHDRKILNGLNLKLHPQTRKLTPP